MMRAEVVIEAAKWLRANNPSLSIRINTNGQANLIYKRDITPELEGLIDCVSISLNAENAEKYQALCRSVFGEAAYDGLLQSLPVLQKMFPMLFFRLWIFCPRTRSSIVAKSPRNAA